MKKMMSVLSGMALVAALGAPAFAEPELTVSDINAVISDSGSTIAQDGSTAKTDNSQTAIETITETTEITSTSDNSTNDSNNFVKSDNVIVEAKLVQVSANVALGAFDSVTPASAPNGRMTPSVTNEIELKDAVKNFSGISNVNLSSGYFNNAASQVTFGVR